MKTATEQQNELAADVVNRVEKSDKVCHFQATWKRAFPWLIYQDGKMCCVDCQNSESNVDSSFVTGCVNF